jgi:hypothetical protein
MTASQAMINGTRVAPLELANQLFHDASAGVKAEPTFASCFDLALASMEFSTATGVDHPALPWFRQGMDLLRGAKHVEPWLYGGAAHAGWTAVQLSRGYGLDVSGLTAFDQLILGWIEHYPTDRTVDLPMGLLGLGVYGLIHPVVATREKFTSAVLDMIEDRAERADGGLFLRSAPARAAEHPAASIISHCDLGVAHGNAGLVSYLSSVVLAELSSSDRAESMLRPAATWLLRQRVDLDGSVFPQAVESRYVPARSAWCYGDPGIALALAVAARATGFADVAGTAREAAAAAIEREPAMARVTDPCLCHGAAGLVWFGRRAGSDFALHGVESYTDHWFGYLRDARAEGTLRYLAPGGMRPDSSFLEGDLGVALACLYLARGGSPEWQQRLLAVPVGAPGK